MGKKETEITIQIELDENNVPETIHWAAQDGGIEDEEAKAMFLYAWNEPLKETLKLDLWTKEMPVDSMKKFFHQILGSMAQTYSRATDDQETVKELEKFTEHFAKKSGIIK